MTDSPTQKPPEVGSRGSSPAKTPTGASGDPMGYARSIGTSAWNFIRLQDLALPAGLISILVVLLMPIPPFFMDFLLTVSIGISLAILLTVIFIRSPLELNSFPTILLIATMLRLALNVASTRLILTNGQEGTSAAGQVIQAFGDFVAGGNYVVGLIVFAILVIINFVVITKGAGRIAEVAARFALDAMPGKQMAIDADLSSGLINEAQARGRRTQLEQESSFYGAMDGASKFVRGDAIAGILITFINIVGGIIVGTVQNGMDLGQAAQTYTLLTVGDGLVTQIPALVVSTAAGLLTTKTGQSESTEQILFGQFSRYPIALALSALLMFVMALLPQLPAWPFVTLGLLAAFGAWRLRGVEPPPVAGQEFDEQTAATGTDLALKDPDSQPEETISTALHIDMIRLEMGYGLLPLINANNELRLTDQIKALRRQIAAEYGFVMPPVRIQDNLQIPADTYVLRIKEIESGRGDIRPNMLLVMDPRGEPITLSGESTTEPTFGLPALWISATAREEAILRGYTVVDPSTVITTHLTEVIKENMGELLSYAETQNLLDEMAPPQKKLVEDIIPAQISLGAVQRVLQNLLSERISVRDLPTILEGAAEAVAYTSNIVQITEHVRSRLARQISDANTDGRGLLSLVTLSPEWEQSFAESIVIKGEDRQLSMAPSRLQQFIKDVRRVFDQQAREGETPCLLVSPVIRPFVRSVIERFRPTTVVLSQNEIYPKAKIRTVAQI